MVRVKWIGKISLGVLLGMEHHGDIWRRAFLSTFHLPRTCDARISFLFSGCVSLACLHWWSAGICLLDILSSAHFFSAQEVEINRTQTGCFCLHGWSGSTIVFTCGLGIAAGFWYGWAFFVSVYWLAWLGKLVIRNETQLGNMDGAGDGWWAGWLLKTWG